MPESIAVNDAGVRTPDYHRACAECATGCDCSQPYVSMDGTTYWCERIFPALDPVGQEGESR